MKFQRELLKQLRVERKWSRKALEEASGITGQAIWEIESGRTKNPTTPTVEALAQALNVAPALFYADATNSGEQAVKQLA